MATTLEVLDTHCYLIRNALDIQEQIAVFEDIQSKERTATYNQPTKPRALYPSPRTLQLGCCDDENNENFLTKIKFPAAGDDGGVRPTNIFSRLVDKANEIILRTPPTMTTMTTAVAATAAEAAAPTVNLCEYKSITLSVIEYEAEKHTLAEHVDHDNSFVYLLSIGCTANFVVKGPTMAMVDDNNDKKEQQLIRLRSGDLLVFDASTKGNIRHGIQSIDNCSSNKGELASCPLPEELTNRFPILRNHRYGIQLRVRF